MNRSRKLEKGITLIALVITVVVMLVIAGVAISALTGDGGLFEKTKVVANTYEQSSQNEADVFKNLENELDKYWNQSESDDSVEVNWDEVLADANSNPDKYKHPDQANTNNDIGIGTDGKPVNLDLWYYLYGGSEITLVQDMASPGLSNGYKDQNATKIEGKMPQYIKLDGKEEFYPVTSLLNTFAGCHNLQEIPKLPSTVNDIEATFYGCTSLNNIPSDIFDNCPNIIAFKYTFYGCTGLESIPSDLFNNCQDAYRFYYTFANCTGLTTIPEALFSVCTNATNFGCTFENCTGLTSIPEKLFDNCQNIENFYSVFEGCTGLTSIPEGLFDNCPNIKSFRFAFAGCTSLTGNAPELWNRSNVTDKLECFKDCTNLSNYDEIPDDWK